MHNRDARDLRQTAEQTAGLVRQMQRHQTVALELQAANRRSTACAGAIERYVPPLGCYRTVSQRSLSFPTTFLSRHRRLNWGAAGGGPLLHSLFHDLLNDVTLGASWGAIVPPDAHSNPPEDPDSLRFLDNNGPARARVNNLVLVAMRAKVSVQLTFEKTGLASFNEQYPAGRAVKTFEDFIRDYIAIGLYHTADSRIRTGTVQPSPGEERGYPWVDFTPLRYFDRPDGQFMAVPPLLWRGRDTHAVILARKGEHGTADNWNYNNTIMPYVGSVNTTTGNLFINAYGQASLLVEALFVPSPEACGDQWPGELAPTHKIGNHPDYNPGLPVFPVVADDAPNTVECSTCGCERPTPAIEATSSSSGAEWSILDPRHNLREATKQMLLLEQHLFDESKWCPDCVQKHCLMIEALGDEGRTLDKDGTDAGKFCEHVAKTGKDIYNRLQAGQDKQQVATDLRMFRKDLTKRLRAWVD